MALEGDAVQGLALAVGYVQVFYLQHEVAHIFGLSRVVFGVLAQAVGSRPINKCSERSRRRGALRSEIKEEPEGRGTFAEQGTPSA